MFELQDYPTSANLGHVNKRNYKMRYQRILLITNPVSTETGSLRPNIGLGYIAEVLDAYGIEYDVLDMMLGYTRKDLYKKIEAFKPDLLGVNMFSNKYKTAYDTIAGVKKSYPGIDIVVGGPHVSCLKEDVLSKCPAIDYGIVLEGEQSMLELCQGVDLKEIKGLIYRNGKELCFSSMRMFNDNLDELPIPTYSRFEIDKYIEEKALVSSRGCPYNCIYCAVGNTIGKKIRIRSPQNVVDEIQYWYEKGYRQFSFQDDNFTFYKQRVLDICDEIEKRKFKNLLLRCAGARADKLDRFVLGRMREVGFKTIAIGVEAGNDRMLKILRKGETYHDIDNAVKSACDLDFDVYLNFLVGSPSETMSDIQDTINFALKYPVFYVDFFNIIPYPSTELYGLLKEKGYLRKEPEEYLNDTSTESNDPVFETPELSLNERKRLLLSLKKVRRKVLRKALDRRLKQGGTPWGLRSVLAYTLSTSLLAKLFSSNRVRKLADKIRFFLYMKRMVKSNSAP